MTGPGSSDATDLPALDPRRLSLLWAVQGHVAGIAALHATMFETGWSEAEIARLLLHPGSVALVATAGQPNAIGGFAMAQVAADEAEILTIGVAEGWRRNGVAARLVDGIKRASAKAGARSLFLEVADSNVAARGLYARKGFTQAGRRQGYYARAGAPAEDALILRCALVPA